MKNIKKTSLALVLSILIGSTFAAPKAEAGVVTVIGSAVEGSMAGVAAGNAISWGGFALFEAFTAVNNTWHIVGIVLIALDASQPLTNDGIEQFLAKKYPFIDDREVISDLATLVRTKIVSSGGLNQGMTVSIPENEVRTLLANSSLTDEQTQAVVTALK